MRPNFRASPGHLQIAHDHLRRILKAGDSALDATAGNGHDSLFLAECIGENGELFAFDIQAAAIAESRRRLEDHGVSCAVHWIHDSHAEIGTYITGPLQGALFNLGYLPGGDKSLITRGESTLRALRQLEPLMGPGAGLSIVAYVGHDGGWSEYEQVKEWAESQAKSEWSFFEWRRLNRDNAPIVIMGEKAQ